MNLQKQPIGAESRLVRRLKSAASGAVVGLVVAAIVMVIMMVLTVPMVYGIGALFLLGGGALVGAVLGFQARNTDI